MDQQQCSRIESLTRPTLRPVHSRAAYIGHGGTVFDRRRTRGRSSHRRRAAARGTAPGTPSRTGTYVATCAKMDGCSYSCGSARLFMMPMLCVWLAVEVQGDVVLGPPTNLRVEGLLSEVAVLSEPRPEFSFEHPPLPTGVHAVRQASYRLTVVAVKPTSTEQVASELVWDSGEVLSAQCTGIAYDGPALSPFARYIWTAQWAQSGNNCSDAPRAAAHFETGPMSSKDWRNASWFGSVGPEKGLTPQLRLKFDLPTRSLVAWARVYVGSLGCHNLEINGVVPSPDLRGICPWVNNAHDVRYQTHDITSLLRPGPNALGLLLGHAFGSPSAVVLVMVHMTHEVGSPRWFTSSSANWTVRDSYVTNPAETDCVWCGAYSTSIDWRQREAGWSSPSFVPSEAWVTDVPYRTQPSYPQRAIQMPLATALAEHRPVRVDALGGGRWLYTFERNFVGTLKLWPLPGASAGSNLTIQLGEWLSATTTPATATPRTCGEVAENAELTLGCAAEHSRITSVTFVSFGTPRGNCTSGWAIDPDCDATAAKALLQRECVGKPSCAIKASVSVFGDPCHGVKKLFAASVSCSKPQPPIGTPPLLPETPESSPIFPTISGHNVQYENHVLASGNTAPLETMFCYHGFQYALVTSRGHTTFSGELYSVLGLEIRTNISSTGSLSFRGDGKINSSREHAANILSGIDAMTRNSQQSNVPAYLPTDCPTREKHGWLGDALQASEQALYNFDMRTIHRAFLQKIADSAGPNGDVPVAVPGTVAGDVSCNDIAWTSAFPQIAAMQYRYYGDARTAARQWSALQAYTENLLANASGEPHQIAVCDRFGDWNHPRNFSCTGLPAGSNCDIKAEMGGFNFVLALRAMADMAKATENRSAMYRYRHLADKATDAFHARFFNTALDAYGGDSGEVQSLTVPALAIDLSKRTNTSAVVEALATDVQDRGLGVGSVTAKSLLNVLSDHGHHGLALHLATSTAQPSWGYWLTQNATSCWESWAGSGTRNHIFLCGGVSEWMWKSIVGLTPSAPGFTEVRIAPRLHPVEGPSHVAASFRSVSGVISSAWTVLSDGQRVRLSVKLPVGVHHATIVVPKPFAEDSQNTTVYCGQRLVWDSRALVGSHPGIKSAVDRPTGVEFNVSNGVFDFIATIDLDLLL